LDSFDTAVSETVGDALKSAAKAFSAGDATGDKAGSVGGKFRSDGEIGKEGEKGESFVSSLNHHSIGRRTRWKRAIGLIDASV
jgi:hypothetical protein